MALEKMLCSHTVHSQVRDEFVLFTLV